MVDTMGVWWLLEKAGAHTVKLSGPAHSLAWGQGQWQGCKPMNTIPDLTSHSRHLPRKQTRGSRWARFLTRTTDTMPKCSPMPTISTCSHLPFLIGALETLSHWGEIQKNKTDAWRTSIEKQEAKRAWRMHLHSFHHPSLITMRDSWSLPSRSSQSWGARCSVTPEPGNKDVPKVLCMEKAEVLVPTWEYFLAHCICIESCPQLKLGLFRLVRLWLSSVPWPVAVPRLKEQPMFIIWKKP